MICKVSGKETDNKWRNLSICKEEIEKAKLKRDKVNEGCVNYKQKANLRDFLVFKND